jgi:hypothetical protein
MNISMTALGKKILSYREIDTSLAVACLSAVPYDLMVRELKAAVPSIQSDFSRLRTVAFVGEELAHLWDQEDLLIVFQALQTNAKWWHTLSSYGIKADPRAFQSADNAQRDASIRSIVPELLEKSNGNLSLVEEYCRQFELEASWASLSYIQKVLTKKPVSVTSTEWIYHARHAASSLSEPMLLCILRTILNRIDPFDYEKVMRNHLFIKICKYKSL